MLQSMKIKGSTDIVFKKPTADFLPTPPHKANTLSLSEYKLCFLFVFILIGKVSMAQWETLSML